MIHKNEIVIRYSKQIDKENKYLSGYSKSLTGKSMSYHCFHSEASQALLARVKTNENRISWMTDEIPVGQGNECTFVWIAAVCRSKSRSHKFDLYINGEYSLTLRTILLGDKSQFPIVGQHGVKLNFQTMMIDQFDDEFGWMFLTIEKDKYKEGTPLTMEWIGAEAGNQDWLMVFEYELKSKPRLRCEPVLLQHKGTIVQELTIQFDHLSSDTDIVITSALDSQTGKLSQMGMNKFQIPIPAVSKPTELIITTITDTPSEEKILIHPVSPRSVHVLSFSHNDIGYTELQEVVLRKQCNNIDDSLELIKKTLNNPGESQFRWNLEVIWALEEWWNQASKESKIRFTGAVKSGHIGLNALYTNPLTGLANEVELAHQLYYALWFQKETGLKIQTSAVTDIPGFVWGLVTALDDAGVKYFSIAPNSGDRVGHIYEGLGDKPFYWLSQDGSKRVLTWVAGAGYSMFHRERLSGNGIRKLLDYLSKIQDKHYPFDMVILPYTIGGDNGGPDNELPAFVKEWNERYDSPRIVISTHQHFFETFENKYGKTLPTLKGDMTPYWEDGAFSTAAETALNRHASTRLMQVEALAQEFGRYNQFSERIKETWKNIVLYDEHTWGAWNSVSEPEDPKVKQQWETKRQFAVRADEQSRLLLSEILHERTMSLDSNEQRVIDIRDNICTFQDTKIEPRLENKRFKLEIDEQGGYIKSLWVKSVNAELVDACKGLGLGHFLYVRGTDSSITSSLQNVRLISKQSGPIFDMLQIQADAPGCSEFFFKVRLHHQEDKLDLHFKINKQAVREKEGMHIAFPFLLPGGILRYNVANSIVVPEKDQLPGSNKNFFTALDYVDVSNDEIGITCALIDSPLFEMGSLNAEKPWLKSIEPSTTFFSYVLNNYWHTNYKADQEGWIEFRYALLFHKEFDAEVAFHFARSTRSLLSCS
jgi:alpha-mannosidase